MGVPSKGTGLAAHPVATAAGRPVAGAGRFGARRDPCRVDRGRIEPKAGEVPWATAEDTVVPCWASPGAAGAAVVGATIHANRRIRATRKMPQNRCRGRPPSRWCSRSLPCPSHLLAPGDPGHHLLQRRGHRAGNPPDHPVLDCSAVACPLAPVMTPPVARTALQQHEGEPGSPGRRIRPMYTQQRQHGEVVGHLTALPSLGAGAGTRQRQSHPAHQWEETALSPERQVPIPTSQRLTDLAPTPCG